MTKFRLMVNRPLAGGESGTDFIEVVAWRRLAEICGDYLKKGQLVLVEGRIQNRSFEDQLGQKRWVTEVVARNITMLEKSQAATHPSRVAAEPEDRDSAPEAFEEFVDDTELISDLPF
jgi:single-strand DNA-binding protein